MSWGRPTYKWMGNKVKGSVLKFRATKSLQNNFSVPWLSLHISGTGLERYTFFRRLQTPQFGWNNFHSHQTIQCACVLCKWGHYLWGSG